MSQRSGGAEGSPCDRLLELHQRERPSGRQRGLDDLVDRILPGRHGRELTRAPPEVKGPGAARRARPSGWQARHSGGVDRLLPLPFTLRESLHQAALLHWSSRPPWQSRRSVGRQRRWAGRSAEAAVAAQGRVQSGLRHADLGLEPYRPALLGKHLVDEDRSVHTPT